MSQPKKKYKGKRRKENSQRTISIVSIQRQGKEISKGKGRKNENEGKIKQSPRR